MRYFLASYYKKPTGKINEAIKLDTKVRTRDLQTASVIIDYKERKIVKSNFAEELGPDNQHDFDTINNFYKGHYPREIAQLEAKYEVLDAAMKMVSTIIDDEEDSADVESKIEDIADDAD